MTAEVAVLNSEAIALAADSAATVSHEHGHKIFASANKIFGLSRHHPVGIMVYGGAQFMNVPWEAIVKLYRHQLGVSSFPTVDEYAADFRSFVASSNLVPAAAQARFLERMLEVFFGTILNEVLVALEDLALPATDADVRRVVADVVARWHADWLAKPQFASIDGNAEASIATAVKSLADPVRRRVFERMPMTTATRRKLRELGEFVAIKSDASSPFMSGVVFAGFGDDEIFPSLHSYTFDGQIEGVVRSHPDRATAIDDDNRASIMAFAQGEVVSGFMEGVDPNYQAWLSGSVGNLLETLESAISAVLPPAATTAIRRAFGQAEAAWLDAASERRRRYVDPVISVVSFLPKDELAQMAETLVTLTSFRRRVSLDAETVGGPIDVAVISKGDGFVWIRRKHYFEASINPHFMSRYLK